MPDRKTHLDWYSGLAARTGQAAEMFGIHTLCRA